MECQIREDKAKKFFQLAEFQANLFSKDPITKVGAICLAPNSLQILSQGYNGLPRKINEDIPDRWQRPTKNFYVSHAEANLVANACRHGTPLEGSIAVVTLFPCATCAKLLIQAGISTLVTKPPDMACPRWGEEFKYSLEMLREAEVHIQYVSTLSIIIHDLTVIPAHYGSSCSEQSQQP
jgi:dCMP deaminase